MRFFRFYADGDNAVSLDPQDLRYFESHFIGERMEPTWAPPEIPVQNKTKPLRDFVSWLGSAMVITGKAKIALKCLISKQVEFLPLLAFKGSELFAVNVLETINCLDHKSSRVTFSKDDPQRVIHIDRFIFDESRIQNVPIFKVPEWSTAVFVSEDFVRLVVRSNLTGAGFENPEGSRFFKKTWDGTLAGLPQVRDFKI